MLLEEMGVIGLPCQSASVGAFVHSEVANERMQKVLAEEARAIIPLPMRNQMENLAKNLRMSVMFITPEVARQILENCNGRNYRNMSEASKVRYAKVMKTLAWLIGPALFFDDEGFLLDGQTRLGAVVLSDVGQCFLVIEGLPKESTKAFDNGHLRSKLETLKWLLKKENPNSAQLSKIIDNAPIGLIPPILVAIKGGMEDSGYINNAELERVIIKYRSVIGFMLDIFFPKDESGKRSGREDGITRAHTVAVFCRAYLKHQNNPAMLTRVREAAEGMAGNFGSVKQNPSIAGFEKLRNWLVKNGGFSGGTANRVIHLLVANCLQQYLNGETTTFKEPKWKRVAKVGGGEKRKLEVEKSLRNFKDPFEVEVDIAVVDMPKAKRGRPAKKKK